MRESDDFVAPMLAVTSAHPFSRPEWWFETKWDGYRVIISVGDRFHVYSRNGHDLTQWYPSVLNARNYLGEDTVLDGELLAWVNGRPNFNALQRKSAPHYVLMVFDCLYRRGRWILQEPLMVRQAELRDQVVSGGMVVVVEGVQRDGEEFLAANRAIGLEGVMAKRLDSPYLPGRRSSAWQKFLIYHSEWFWVVAASQAADQRWYWHVAEQEQGRWRHVARVRAASYWRPTSVKAHAGETTAPFPVEVEYRERTREGHLRDARIRQWISADDGHSASDITSGAHFVSGERDHSS